MECERANDQGYQVSGEAWEAETDYSTRVQKVKGVIPVRRLRGQWTKKVPTCHIISLVESSMLQLYSLSTRVQKVKGVIALRRLRGKYHNHTFTLTYYHNVTMSHCQTITLSHYQREREEMELFLRIPSSLWPTTIKYSLNSVVIQLFI